MQKKQRIHSAFAFVAIAIFAALAQPALAQDEDEEEIPAEITAIEAKTGIVTAQHTATGQIFRFRVTDAATLESLHVGQGVWANFDTGKIRIYGGAPCCSIVPAAGGARGLAGAAVNVRGQVNPVEPCCGIIAINARTGIVTARNTATGKTFQFRASTAVARGLRVGQPIFANFAAAGRIGVTPSEPCCNIVP